jgi:hypothetical protein
MPETATVEITPEMLARGLKQELAGVLEAKVDAMAESVAAMTTRHAATGAVVSLAFYLEIEVKVKQGKTFNGKAGGITTPGAAFTVGTVYTDDLDRLYRSTRKFMFTSTSAYFAVYFFDSDDRPLGTYQAFAISLVTGPGGGSGRWS